MRSAYRFWNTPSPSSEAMCMSVIVWARASVHARILASGRPYPNTSFGSYPNAHPAACRPTASQHLTHHSISSRCANVCFAPNFDRQIAEKLALQPRYVSTQTTRSTCWRTRVVPVYIIWSRIECKHVALMSMGACAELLLHLRS